MELFLILLFWFQVAAAAPPAISKIYRTDYSYNKKTDAFYKFHVDEVGFRRAEEICSLEGAKLITPINQGDLSQVHSMMKKYPDIHYVWIGDDGQQHDSLNEKVVVFGDELKADEDDYGSYYSTENESKKCDVIDRFGEIKTPECYGYGTHPFVCKVEAKDAPYDDKCDVFDTGYEYYANVSSCYKVSRVPTTWNAAYADCQAVGSHMAVVNSEAESRTLKEVMHKSPRHYGSRNDNYINIGFRTIGRTREFMTIFNQTLEQAGFAQWTQYEPNNIGDNEYCGSIYWDGKLNDVNCDHRYRFICEKEKSV